MSFFNISYFNAGLGFLRLYETPSPSSYSNIKLFGAGKFGTLYGERRIYSSSDISSINPKVEQDWLTDTYINAKFDNNLQAGNYTSLASPIDGWIIQRKATTDAKFTTIAEVGAMVDTYEDNLVSSKQTYIYQLIPKAGTVLGAPLESDPVSTNFRTVILLDPLTQEGYSFCLNLQIDGITVNEDITTSDTKGKYQTVVKGNRRFKSGSIGIIASSSVDINGGIDQNVAFLNQLEDFIQNSNEKIIKFPNGFTFRVSTGGFNYTKLDGVDANGNMLWAVSYDWAESGDL